MGRQRQGIGEEIYVSVGIDEARDEVSSLGIDDPLPMASIPSRRTDIGDVPSTDGDVVLLQQLTRVDVHDLAVANVKVRLSSPESDFYQ
jgi:hypothetical protein